MAEKSTQDGGSGRLSMTEYQQLSQLLKRAKDEGRLGEALVFSGMENDLAPALQAYNHRLSGGQSIPVPLSLDHALPVPKTAAQRGKDALSSMSMQPGASAAGIQQSGLNVAGIQQSGTSSSMDMSWMVNARGEIVHRDSQQLVHTPKVSPADVQPPAQEQTLRWKSKWNKETGTASAIGYPAPPRQVPEQQPSSSQSAMSSIPEFMVHNASAMIMSQDPNAMEVGRAKRGNDGEMVQDEEEDSQWALVHDEVLARLTDGLTGVPFQRDGPPRDENLWWSGVDYSVVDGSVQVPAKANGSVQRWGQTAAEKLPRLKRMGLEGRSYENLVQLALNGNRELATYLAWLRSTFDGKYLRQGASSPGVDLAGFLMAVKFEVPVDTDGFARRFVD